MELPRHCPDSERSMAKAEIFDLLKKEIAAHPSNSNG
jgi:hypothetical protein